MPDVQPHNLNALLLGTGEFSFCEDALTEAAAGLKGYRDWGNVVAFSIKPDLQKVDHIGSYRGVRRIDTTAVKQTETSYQLKLDEIGRDRLQSLFYGDVGTPFTQTVKAAVAGDSLDFSVTNAVIGYWYDLMIGGVRIKELTAATLAHGTGPSTPLVEHTDFELDKKLGRVRFLTAQTWALDITITAPAITSASVGYRQTITPQTKPIRRGIGRLICFDQHPTDPVVFEHSGFACEVYLDSMDEIDGDKYANVMMTVQVTSPVGTVYTREQ